MIRVASIGECMIELQEAGGAAGAAPLRRTFGGDTLNTAVYMARALTGTEASVHYVTALGDDPYSAEMQAAWRAEGVATDLVAELPGRMPGLYAIRTDAAGERSFYYWRGEAAARDMMRCPGAEQRLEALTGFDLVYLTGITLGILDDDSRARLIALLGRVRAAGVGVAFDANFRPRLWPDRAAARRWMDRLAGCATLALPTFDDEAALFGDATPEATADRLRAAGCAEVAVKCGAEPCLLIWPDGTARVAPEPVAQVVDTTAAGDSFNAAYITARLTGAPPAEAAARGHALAGRVIGHRGAIVPR